jgi:hypothetical protein
MRGDQDGGDRVAEPGPCEVLCRIMSQRRGRIRHQQHDGRKGRRDDDAKSARHKTQPRAGLFAGSGFLGFPQARGGANEQHTSHAAPDGGLRQRHIDRKKTHPDDR